MKFDVNKMKKIGRSKTHTIYEHPDGHVLHLADGGKVEIPGSEEAKKKISKSFKDALGLAEGGEVPSPAELKEKYDLHKKAADTESRLDELKKTVEQKPIDRPTEYVRPYQGYAEGGEVLSDPQKEEPKQAPAEAGIAGMLANPTPVPQDAPLEPAIVPEANKLPVDPYGEQKKAEQTLGALEQEKKITEDIGQVEAAGAKSQEQQLQKNIGEKVKFEEHVSSELQGLQKEMEAAKADMDNGHFHPKSIFNDGATFDNIRTGIGLVLGGIGGGLLHTENPVMKMLEKQIDRDMEAGGNLYKALEQKYGNRKDALNAERIYKYSVLADQLQSATLKATSQTAQLNGQKAGQELQQKIAAQMGELAKSRTMNQMLGGASQGNIQQAGMMVQQLVPKEQRAEAMKELKQQQNLDTVNSNAMDSFDKVAKLQTLGGRIKSPIQASQQIKALWNPMIDKIVKTNEGRVTPITVELFSDIEPGLRDNEETTALKREKFQNILNSERSAPTLETYGIPIPGSSPVKKKKTIKTFQKD